MFGLKKSSECSEKSLLKRVGNIAFISFIYFGLTTHNAIADEKIPEIYKFIPNDSFISINIKTSQNSWAVLEKNKTFKQAKIFSDFSKSNDLNIIEDKQIRDNIGNNIVISIPKFKYDEKIVSSVTLAKASSNSDPFIMVVEMKNKNKNPYMKAKILKAFSGKSDSKIVESKYRDANIISIIPKTANANFRPSYYVFLNNYLITTNDVDSVQKAVKSYYGTNNLSNLSNFSKSYYRMNTDYQVQMYVNMKNLAELFFDNIPDKSNLGVLKDHGIFSNESMMMNLELAENNLELKTYIIPVKNSNAAKAIMQNKPATLSMTRLLPKESIAYLGLSDFNLSEYLNNLTLTTDGTKKINYKEFREKMGFDLLEVSNNIKGENGIVAFSTQKNPFLPGFAVFATPKDLGKMLKTLNSVKIDVNLIKQDKGRRNQKSKATNTKKEYLTFSEIKNYNGYKMVLSNEVSDLEVNSIRPVYTVIDEKIIISSNEEVMKSIIDRAKNNDSDFTLEKNLYFANLKEILGNNNNTLGYINLDTIVSMIGTFNDGKSKDMKYVMTNLKKFHAIGFNSINDKDGVLSRIVIMADIDKIDFNALFPDTKSKIHIDMNDSKTYY